MVYSGPAGSTKYSKSYRTRSDTMKIRTLLISKSFLIVVLTTFSIIGTLTYQKKSLQKHFNTEIARLGQSKAKKLSRTFT